MAEMEFFPEQRNLEDLWLYAFPDGPGWQDNDYIEDFEWNFENLEETLEEGGQLYGKTVYLFGSTEPQLLYVNGETKIVIIPVVVAVDCPFPPSDKIGINSFHLGKEEIVPMEAMKMAWVPYVPLEDRLSGTDSLKTKIFTLDYTQQSSALEHFETGRFCMPYYMPLQRIEDEGHTQINTM
ncbi:unnamed protein product [Urochloa humidicola]